MDLFLLSAPVYQLRNMEVQLKNAEASEIEEVLRLHYKYHIDFLTDEPRADGFLTTPFTKDHMLDLINNEDGLFIAKVNGDIVAYVMAGSWEYWSRWPIFSVMIKGLPDLTYKGLRLGTHNSYQYGPICIDKPLRGSGVLEKIFAFSKVKMSERFPVLVTFVNKANERSFEAHKRKLNLDVIGEFQFGSDSFYEMAGLTDSNPQ